MTKAAKRVLSKISAGLWVLLLVVYVAAKINFFTHYGTVGSWSYVRQHSVYWFAMAGIAFAIWIAGKFDAARDNS
jgi:hypothetical protein